jgi:hypothetical protein
MDFCYDPDFQNTVGTCQYPSDMANTLVCLEGSVNSGGCYEDEGDEYSISDCTCHESCGTCGYYWDPTGSDDCLTCSDPTFEVNPWYDDGTGVCVKSDGCYEDEGDESSIAGCACHETCGVCGYAADPTASDDCLTCSDPTFEVNPIYADGSGDC